MGMAAQPHPGTPEGNSSSSGSMTRGGGASKFRNGYDTDQCLKSREDGGGGRRSSDGTTPKCAQTAAPLWESSTQSNHLPIGPIGPQPQEKHLVHWCRRGLRLHDQPALLEGVRGALTYRLVYLLDPWFVRASSSSALNKWRFLLQSLEDLDANLRQLNSRLFVVRGQPADVFPTLFKEWKTTHLSFEEDPEPYGKIRDAKLAKLCTELGITVISRASHTLYYLEDILERYAQMCGTTSAGSGGVATAQAHGQAPLTLAQFQSVIASMDPPPAPAPRLTAALLGDRAHTPYSETCHDRRYGVPTLEELGFKLNSSNNNTARESPWRGGETEALLRLEHHLEHKAWVAAFGRPNMTPNSLMGGARSTGLSPYLRFGCLSARLFYAQLSDLYKKLKKCNPPLSLHGQLLWREFFYCSATHNPYFDRMAGNPICVQVPWEVCSTPSSLSSSSSSVTASAIALAKWANAQTGFPWIDAIQTQLRQEGWIHPVARHATVCFLTRGTLWISWEECMRVFDELLLDADWSVNAGTCLWLSGSSFFQTIFHLYCPVDFGRKVDPNGDYIRRYVPVLRHYPAAYIHSPWMASARVQAASQCIIGRDYPMPMIDHKEAARRNAARMRLVYQKLTVDSTPTTTATMTTTTTHVGPPSHQLLNPEEVAVEKPVACT